MAIGNPARGDLVLVHTTTGLHGLFVVDAVNGNAVTIAPLDHAGIAPGGYKAQFPTIDKTKDIIAHHAATSISG